MPKVLPKVFFIQITPDENLVLPRRNMLYPASARHNVRFHLVIHPEGILELEMKIIILVDPCHKGGIFLSFKAYTVLGYIPYFAADLLVFRSLIYICGYIGIQSCK